MKPTINIKFCKKIYLSFLGLFLALFFIEISLQVAHLVVPSFYESSDSKVIEIEGKELRILALGDSTSAWGGGNSYPAQLEKLFHDKYPTLNTKVYNRAQSGSSTSDVVLQLKNNISEIRPHYILVMIGINDLFKEQPNPLFSRHIQKYSRLSRLLSRMHFQMMQKRKAPNPLALRSAGPKDIFEKKVTLDELGIPDFKDRKLDPKNDFIFNLAKGSKILFDYMKGNSTNEKLNTAIEPLMIAARIEPKAHESFFRLGFTFRFLQRNEKSEKFLKKAIQLSPTNSIYFLHYSQALVTLKQFERAEQALRYGLNFRADPVELESANTKDNQWEIREMLLLLCEVYKKLGQGEKLSEAVKIGFEMFPFEMRFQKFASKGSDQGSPGILEFTKNIYENPIITDNLRKIEFEIIRAGAQPIFVQYPILPSDPLLKTLRSTSRSRVINSTSEFRKLLESEGYDSAFIDRFAIHFGHYTAKGAGLIAKNVFQSITEDQIFSDLTKK